MMPFTRTLKTQGQHPGQRRRKSLATLSRLWLILALLSTFLVLVATPAKPANAVSGTSAEETWGQTSGGSNTFTQANIDDQGASAKGFNGAQSEVLDPNTGYFFVTDYGSNRVLVYTTDATTHLPSQTAFAVLGQPDMVTTSGARTQSKMNAPVGLALDTARDYLFVADYTNGRVLAFNVGTVTSGQNASYVIGKSSFTSASAVAGASGLTQPKGLAYEPSTKYLYVADGGNSRVLIFDLTTLSSTPAAVHVLGQSNFTTYTAAAGAGGLNSPSGLALDNTNHYLFVTDNNDNRVTAFNVSSVTDGQSAIGVYGQPDFTTISNSISSTKLTAPLGVAVDVARSRLYVADSTSNRIMVFPETPSSTGPTASFVIGQTTMTTNTAAVTATGLNAPRQLFMDTTNDRLYVADNGANRVLTFDGSMSSNAPTASYAIGHVDTSNNPDYTQDAPWGGEPSTTGLNTPYATAIDTVHHRLFVSDYYNNRVVVHNLNSSNKMVDNIADNVIGEPDLTSHIGAATSSSLYHPSAVVYSPITSRLFVYDAGNNRVMVFNVSTVTNGMAAVYVLGASTFTAGTGATSQSTFGSGSGLALDDLGNRLFVADGSYNRVLVFNVDMTTIANGENASNVLGQGNYTNLGNGTANTQFNKPRGLAYDSANSRLFVSEFTNNRVTVFDVSSITNGKAASNVLGQAGFGTSTGGTSATAMSQPSSVAYDPTYNRLWVGDSNNNRVLEFDASAITNGATAQSVFGQTDFVSAGGFTTQTGLSGPLGVTFDPTTDRLIVTEQGNNRLTVWRVGSKISSTSLPDAVSNQAYSAMVRTNVAQGTVTYSISGGALPTGLSLSSAGVISGTPTSAGGTYTFTVGTSDNAGSYGTFTDSKSLSIVVTGLATSAGTSPDEEWGQYAAGSQTFSQSYIDSTGPSANGFQTPYASAFDPNTNTLFVVDNADNRVLAFAVNSTTHVPSNTAYAVFGQPDFATINSAAGTSKMSGPRAVAIDSARHQLFVADYGNGRVLVYDISSAPTINQTPAFVIGKTSLTVTTPTTGQIGMTHATGVAYDSGTKYLYVSDDTLNRVLVFDLTTMSNGPTATAVIGQPDYTTTSSGLTASKMTIPIGVALDTTLHYLFVADQTNNRVLGFNVSSLSNGMAATGVFGQADFTSGGAGTTSTTLSIPMGVSVDAARNRLYVADGGNNRLLVFNDSTLTSPTPTATYVVGQASMTVGTASTNIDRFATPRAVTYDSTLDTVFVGDGTNNRVEFFDASFTSNGPSAFRALGHPDAANTYDYTTQAKWGAAPVDYALNAPNDTVIDTVNHRMFVSDGTNNRVLVHSLDTSNRMVDKNADYVIGQPDFVSRQSGTGAANLSFPTGMVYEPSTNRLYVDDSSNFRVLIYNMASLATGMSASNVLGAASFVAGSGAATQSTFGATTGVALDSARHHLLVVSTQRVLVFDTTSITNGMNATYVIGQSSFTTVGSNTTATGLATPRGIVYDSYMDVFWLVDRTNARVLGYPAASLATNMAATYILGNTSFTTVNNGTSATQFSIGVTEVEVDPTYHRLWVSDLPSSNARILEFSTDNFTNGEAATAVYGEPDFTSSGLVAGGLGLSGPTGIAYDPTTNRIWVSEQSYHRVSAWEVGTRITTASLPNGSTAGAYSSQLTNTAAHGAITYALTSGSLPSGVSLSSSGLISGTVTAPAGIYTFSVGLTDTNGTYGTFKDYKTYSVTVPPSFSFGVGAVSSCNGVSQSAGVSNSATALTFGHMSAASSAASMQSLTVNANSTSGYNVYLSSTGLSDGFGHTVPNVSGTNTAPGAAPVGGTSGVGYTTDDSTLNGGTPNRFTTPSVGWAGFSPTGDVVDSSTSSTGGSNQTQCVGVQMAFGTSTSAGNYSGTLVYNAIPVF